MKIKIEKMAHAETVSLPEYASAGSAGMDLRAAIDEPLVIHPGKWKLIETGLKMAIPEGYEGQIRPRSGLALKHGITVLNSPSTIDSDYRGELKIVLINHGDIPFTVNKGERIAQLVFSKVVKAEFQLVEKLPNETVRGEGGFGHTGK